MGRPITVVGTESYRKMFDALCRDRKGVLEDPKLEHSLRRSLLTSMDALIDLLVPLQPRAVQLERENSKS